MTLTELHAGFLNQWEERMAAGLLATFKMLEMSDSAIFQRAGIFMRHYRASHNIDVADALIAATAEHHGVQFATLNVKHFPMFPRLRRAY